MSIRFPRESRLSDPPPRGMTAASNGIKKRVSTMSLDEIDLLDNPTLVDEYKKLKLEFIRICEDRDMYRSKLEMEREEWQEQMNALLATEEGKRKELQAICDQLKQDLEARCAQIDKMLERERKAQIEQHRLDSDYRSCQSKLEETSQKLVGRPERYTRKRGIVAAPKRPKPPQTVQDAPKQLKMA